MAKKNQLTTSDHLTYDEFDYLLKKLRGDKLYFWELYARLSFCTACRASDVLHLTWNSVLNTNQCVITEQKTGKTRKVTFNPTVQRKIKELYDLMGRPDKEAYIFANKKDGTPISIQYVNKMLKKFKHDYKLTIRNFSSHTFRKTFGRYVYDKNNHSAESLLLLNKILNHSTIQITKTYIGITQDEINSIYDSIKF